MCGQCQKNEKSRARVSIREPRGLERRAGVAVHHARVHDVRPCPRTTGKTSGSRMRPKALFAPRPELAKRAARDTRSETAASIEKPKSRYRRSRSANRAALRAERATPTSRRATSARNGVLTCRSASFGRRACGERRVRFASPSPRGVAARRKGIGPLNPRPKVLGDPSRETVFAKNARSATARCYALNERHRPRDARLRRGIVSLDVDQGRVTVAHVRAGVSTQHRRLEERRVALRKTPSQTKSNTNQINSANLCWFTIYYEIYSWELLSTPRKLLKALFFSLNIWISV